jgi:ribonuclease MRP protein subunit SNM1
MASTSISSRLKYLDEARQLLLNTSPAISAHLGAERDLIARQTDLRLADAHRPGSCGACGSLLIPDQNCMATDLKNATKYHCSRCNSYTIQRKPSRSDQPTALRVTKSSSADSKDANASSKKRAKARKHGGLQAMLAHSKVDAKSASASKPQLGLVDFMKASD